jgi:hypothetical protein
MPDRGMEFGVLFQMRKTLWFFQSLMRPVMGVRQS